MDWGRDESYVRKRNYYINTSLTRRSGPDKCKKKGGERKKKLPQAARCMIHVPPEAWHSHCVTKVVLFVEARRDSDNETCGSDTGSLCRSRSKEAGTVELRAESDDADERIGEARFRTRGRGGNEDGAWFSPCDCRGG